VQETVPGWLLAMLGAAAMLALIACFGTGVCEVGIVIGGLGAAAAAALLFILRGLGLANDGSSGASADLGDAGGAADVGVAST
jgi:hypothetical protein